MHRLAGVKGLTEPNAMEAVPSAGGKLYATLRHAVWN
jgi:hypothetical protein